MGLRIINKVQNKRFLEERLEQLRNLLKDRQNKNGVIGASTEAELVEFLSKIEEAKDAIKDCKNPESYASEVELEIKDANADFLSSLGTFAPSKVLDLL